MNLKNYTSDVPATRSISRIEQKLVELGAKNINKEYENQLLQSFSFLLDVNQQTVAFKLPAKVEKVYRVIWSKIKRPQDGTEKRVRAQAERTAWKIVSDWVDIQASMIMLEQAELLEVFLPYVWNPKENTTLYERIKGEGFKLLQS